MLNRNRVPTKNRPPRRCGPTKLRRKQFPRNRALRSNTNTNHGRTTAFVSHPPRPGGFGRGESPSRPPEHGRLNRNRVPTKYRPPRRCGPTKLRRKQFPRNRALRSNTNTNHGRTTVFGSRPPRPGGSGRGGSPSRPSRTACESRTEFLTQIAVASEMRPYQSPTELEV
jgi:hypothetical protein